MLAKWAFVLVITTAQPGILREDGSREHYRAEYAWEDSKKACKRKADTARRQNGFKDPLPCSLKTLEQIDAEITRTYRNSLKALESNHAGQTQ